MRRRWRVGLLLSLAMGVGARAVAEPVALTFDDVPGLELREDPAYALTTEQRLVAELRRHHLPAIGFVNGEKFAADTAVRRRLLDLWISAGFELGNHTWSHVSLNRVTPQAYDEDVGRNDALLRTLGVAPRWFRHPYLETGATAATKRAVEAWLRVRGYRVAPVTLENADDVFALPYDDALEHGDREGAARIRAEYLEHTRRCVAWYRQAAQELLGRRPALIFLLHASRLNADSVSELRAILRADHLRPVTLDAAMQDPAYRQADDPDVDGDDWLNRWASHLQRDLPWDSFPEPPAAIVAASARLDTEP